MQNKFTGSLLKEIELTQIKESQIETIFIGGGTPSLLSIDNLEKIINQLDKKFNLSGLKEFSIETNPGTLNSELLTQYLKLGINRLSVGVQSLIHDELKFLQRIHSADEAINNIINAREIGFENINADLIFSIPGQTYENLKYNIDTLINAGITHLSAYSLIYEENTPLYNDLISGKISQTDDESESDVYIDMIDYLKSKNFNQYEISNFSTSGMECLHNLNYWRRKEYYGFGPSAHSFIDNERYYNCSDLSDYSMKLKQNTLPIIEREEIDCEKEISEIVYLGLRAEGLEISKLEQLISNADLERIEKYLQSLERNGFVFRVSNFYKLTSKGYAMCDHITVKVLELLG